MLIPMDVPYLALIPPFSGLFRISRSLTARCAIESAQCGGGIMRFVVVRVSHSLSVRFHP